MQNHIKSLTPSNIVAHLGHIFHHSGSQAYLGEPVTMAQHMLQGASLAEHQGHSNIVIAAALLHDIGHFTSDFGTFSMDDSHDRQHEVYGAKVLAPFFPVEAPTAIVFRSKKFSLGVSFTFFLESQSNVFFRTAEISPLYSGLDTINPDEDIRIFFNMKRLDGIPFSSTSSL